MTMFSSFKKLIDSVDTKLESLKAEVNSVSIPIAEPRKVPTSVIQQQPGSAQFVPGLAFLTQYQGAWDVITFNQKRNATLAEGCDVRVHQAYESAIEQQKLWTEAHQQFSTLPNVVDALNKMKARVVVALEGIAALEEVLVLHSDESITRDLVHRESLQNTELSSKRAAALTQISAFEAELRLQEDQKRTMIQRAKSEELAAAEHARKIAVEMETRRREAEQREQAALADAERRRVQAEALEQKRKDDAAKEKLRVEAEERQRVERQRSVEAARLLAESELRRKQENQQAVESQKLPAPPKKSSPGFASMFGSFASSITSALSATVQPPTMTRPAAPKASPQTSGLPSQPQQQQQPAMYVSASYVPAVPSRRPSAVSSGSRPRTQSTNSSVSPRDVALDEVEEQDLPPRPFVITKEESPETEEKPKPAQAVGPKHVEIMDVVVTTIVPSSDSVEQALVLAKPPVSVVDAAEAATPAIEVGGETVTEVAAADVLAETKESESADAPVVVTEEPAPLEAETKKKSKSQRKQKR